MKDHLTGTQVLSDSASARRVKQLCSIFQWAIFWTQNKLMQRDSVSSFRKRIENKASGELLETYLGFFSQKGVAFSSTIAFNDFLPLPSYITPNYSHAF